MSEIFIIGNSRSGTTLLGRILNKHPSIKTLPHELHIFDEIFLNIDSKELPYHYSVEMLAKIFHRNAEGYFSNDKKPIKKYLDLAKDSFGKKEKSYSKGDIVRLFYRHIKKPDVEFICEQTPRNLFYVDEILSIFPNAKFINLIRDPRGVLLSQKNKWRACKKFGQPKREILRSFFNYHPFNILFLWKKSLYQGELLSNKFPKQVLTIKFDELSKNPLPHLKEICEFLGIDYKNDLVDINVEMTSNLEMEGMRGIDNQVSTTWKNKLSKTEIFIAEQLTKFYIEKHSFVKTNCGFNLIHFFWILLFWPISSLVAVILNIQIIKKIKLLGSNL